MNAYSETTTGTDARVIQEMPPPDETTRAMIILICACLSQVEGAVKKMRELLMAYARGDLSRLAELLPRKS